MFGGRLFPNRTGGLTWDERSGIYLSERESCHHFRRREKGKGTVPSSRGRTPAGATPAGAAPGWRVPLHACVRAFSARTDAQLQQGGVGEEKQFPIFFPDDP